MLQNDLAFRGAPKELLDQYPATTKFGSMLRKADAKKFLELMSQSESDFRQLQETNESIRNSIDSVIAKQRLESQYMVMYGIPFSERELLHHVLTETMEHGGLSLPEAIRLSNAKSLWSTTAQTGIADATASPPAIQSQ